MRLLIVNADDFGLNAAATDGVMQCFLAGAVTSTSLMVNAPDAERAAVLASRYPALAVGLHFNLTWGRPLSDPARVPALLDQTGGFCDRATLMRRALLGCLPQSQVDLEFQSQLARLRELGINPSHFDSHQHVHAATAVFDVLARQSATMRVPMRVPWVGVEGTAPLSRRIRRALLSWMLKRATSRWRGRITWNDGLGSVFDLGANGDPLGDEWYRQILRRASGTAFELMVHPATSATAMDGFTTIGAVAEAEWRYLIMGRLKELAHEEGFRLGSYRDLSPSQRAGV